MLQASQLVQKIVQKTDLCVMCGLCLPHCPTYRANQNEAESPRGRISLIKALAEGALNSDDAFDMHLYNCTGCLSCEAVCPAKVPYSKIIDQGRALHYASQPPARRTLRALILWLFTHRLAQPVLRALIPSARWIPARFSQRAGLYRFTRIASVLEKEEKEKEENEKKEHNENQVPIRSTKPDTSPATESINVTLFSGCTGETLDQTSIESTKQLLHALGFEVRLLPTFTCCGALQQHAGQEQAARKQMFTSANVIANEASGYLVSVATGCGVQIEQYTNQLDTANAKNASSQHYHILDFLERHANLDRHVFTPYNKRVLIHVPCSMMQSKQDAHLIRSLFSRIPELECLEFEDPQYCCGAGGLNLVTQSESAQKLLAPKLEQIMRMQPDTIVSPNIGCALHLRAALKECGFEIAVTHPVTLLLRQLSQ